MAEAEQRETLDSKLFLIELPILTFHVFKICSSFESTSSSRALEDIREILSSDAIVDAAFSGPPKRPYVGHAVNLLESYVLKSYQNVGIFILKKYSEMNKAHSIVNAEYISWKGASKLFQSNKLCNQKAIFTSI